MEKHNAYVKMDEKVGNVFADGGLKVMDEIAEKELFETMPVWDQRN